MFSPNVGQPTTICKHVGAQMHRAIYNIFWPKNMSSITYQKYPKIRVGEVDEKRVFLEPPILHTMETRLHVLPVVLLEFEASAACASEHRKNLLCFRPRYKVHF